MAITRPTVSILMLCRNEAVFIRRAIRSVLMQSFAGPVEIIMVDDGSSDASVWILREEIRLAARANVTLRLVANTVSTGNAAAFVAGLEAARGLYYHVLDCDDYWIDPDKLQTQIALMEAQPELAGVAHRAIVRNQIDQSESFHPQHEPLKRLLRFEDLVMDNLYFHTSAMLFRNHFYQPATESVLVPEIFREVRGDTIRLYVHAARGPILYLPQTMSVYDDHGGGIWTSLDWPGKQALLRNLYHKLDQRGYLATLDEARAKAWLAQRLADIAAYTPVTLRPVSLHAQGMADLPRHRISRISHIATLRDMELQMDVLVRDHLHEDALQLLQRLVTAIAYDANLSKAGQRRRIASFEIDWQCARLGELIGAKRDVLPVASPDAEDGPVVFVVSGMVADLEGLWDEVLDMVALYQARRPVCIISTELLPSAPDVRDRLAQDGIRLMFNTDDRLEDKTSWLMWHLAQLKASQIFLNPARNDVVIAAAVRREHAPRIHLLTALGTGFALCRFSEVIDGFVARRPYDLAYYSKIAPTREIAYIPAFPRGGAALPQAVPQAAPVVTVTVCKDARSLEHAYDYGFDLAIPTVLNSGVARHIHAGPLSEATVNRIRKALAQKGLSPDAFELHPYPADVTAFLRDSGATLFLQSFPLPEQRPLLAALAAGLPVILHYGYLHPMLCLDDICYPGAPVWGTLAELATILRGVSPEWLVGQVAGVQAHMADFGSVEALWAAAGDDLLTPVAPDRIPDVAVPETRHELRRLMTEMMETTVFLK